MALLADAAVLLRAHALLSQPPRRPLLAELMPLQLSLKLEAEALTQYSRAQNANPQNPL